MNRKLHNTTMALIASSSLFVLGLLAGSPTPGPATPASIADAAGFDADKAMAAEAGVDGADAGIARRHARRTRQSVSMPFFSFAPRG